MKEVYLDFNVNEAKLQKELEKVRRAIKGVGDESYITFSRLNDVGRRAFNNLYVSSEQNVYILRKVIDQLRNVEEAQHSLSIKLKEGVITGREYAQQQTELSIQQARLKSEVAALNHELEKEIQLSSQSSDAFLSRRETLIQLANAYSALNKQNRRENQESETNFLNNEQEKFLPPYLGGEKESLPDFKKMYEGFKLLKGTPDIFMLDTTYSLIMDAINQSEKLSKGLDEKVAFWETVWDTTVKRILLLGSSLYNMITGDKNALNKNIIDSVLLHIGQVGYAESAERAVSYKYDLVKQIKEHVNWIKLNNEQIQIYGKKLLESNRPLQERADMRDKVLSYENDNFNYKTADLSTGYEVFKKDNLFIYDSIYGSFKKDLVALESYFKSLNQGDPLNREGQMSLYTSLNRILSSPDLMWTEKAKSTFGSFFTQALANNQTHFKTIDYINRQFNKGNAASSIAPTSNKWNFPSGSKLVASEGGIDDRLKLSFDPIALQQELAEKKQFYQEDVNAYIAYLQEKIAAAKENPAPEGRQEENILKRELGSAKRTKDNRLDGLLSQYQGYTTKMTSLTRTYQADMALLNQAMKEASTEEERKRIEEAIDLRSDGYTASLAGLEAEHAGFSKVLFGDLQQMSKEALDEAIAGARDFISKWSANAGELSPETEKVIERIQAGIDRAESSLQDGDGDKPGKMILAEQFRDAAEALQTCADLAYVFDESLGSVIQTAADVAAGASDVAMGVATFSANPLQGATSILGGVTKIVGSFGKRMQENEQIRKEYLQGLVETYSKELEYNSVLRERLRIQQQLGETSLAYFNRLQGELGKQQGDIDREYTEVWNKLMQEEYVSGTGYKHGTWFRKAKTWNEYDSLAGKSYEEMESLYTQDKLEGSAKTLFERLRQLKEEGADVTEMMDQLNQEMKESWTGTTTSAIADSIVQGFLDGKRSAADFADTFEDMMKTAMMQSVKMKYLEGPLDEWYKRFAEASEGGLTEEKIAELRRQYEQIVENAAREAENMEAITGLGTNAETTRQATAQGIASMSQETASELNGNFYALQYLTSNIDRNVTNIQSVLYQASDHWLRIEENTRYCRKLETIERDMASVRKDMQDINNKGILMRTR